MTDDVRKSISLSRKKYLSENPEKHPWRSNLKFASEPCEKLKERLKSEGFVFEAEWMPIPEQRSFSIDIAFPDIKLGIEINGNQHYNRDGTLRDYYAQRHRLIEASGWNLLEVHFSHCYSGESVAELIQALRENRAHEIDFTVSERKKTKKQIYEEKVRDRNLLRQQRDAERKKVLDSIDKTHFGWVSDASKALGVSHTHVRRLVKRLYPEDTTIFQRKDRQ